MTTLQLALVAGACLMIGPVVLIARYAPRHPSLAAYLESHSGTYTPSTADGAEAQLTLEDKLGLWLQRHIGDRIQIPRAELEMLRLPPHKFLAQKALFATIGLVFPPVLAGLARLLGLPAPIGLPVIGSIALAVGLSFIPDLNARSNAGKARAEFTYVLGSYMDLVALERRAGTSPRQAMEQAAQVGDSWVFKRLSEELAHSRLSGIPPWERLRTLGERYMVPELSELGHIMRIAGSENAAVYANLQQRAKAMRKAHLALELTKANEISTKRSAPVAVLGLIFTLLLVTPAILAMVTV